MRGRYGANRGEGRSMANDRPTRGRDAVTGTALEDAEKVHTRIIRSS